MYLQLQFNSLQITMKNYFIFKSKKSIIKFNNIKAIVLCIYCILCKKNCTWRKDEISLTLVQSIQLQFDRSKLSEYVGKLPWQQLQPLHTPSPQQERVDPTYTIFPDSLWLTLCIWRTHIASSLYKREQ